MQELIELWTSLSGKIKTNSVSLLGPLPTLSIQELLLKEINATCQTQGYSIGHAYIRKVLNTQQFVSTRIWHLEDPEKYKRFQMASEGLVLSPNLGCVGHLYNQEGPQLIEDLSNSDWYLRCSYTRSIGIDAGLLVPIFANGSLVVVLEFYMDCGKNRNRASDIQRAKTVANRLSLEIEKVWPQSPPLLLEEKTLLSGTISYTHLICLSPLLSEELKVVDFKFEYMNEATRQLAGLQNRNYTSSTLLSLLPSLKDRFSFEMLRQVCETGKPWVSSPHRSNGLRYQANKIFDVITVMWISQQPETQKKNLLLDASRCLSHEINNPLTVILGNTHILKEVMKDHSPSSKSGEMLNSIETQASRIRDSIQKIDDASLLFSEVDQPVLSIDEMLQFLKQQFEPLMSQNSIEFSIVNSLGESLKPLNYGHILHCAHILLLKLFRCRSDSKRWICIHFQELNDFLWITISQDSSADCDPTNPKEFLSIYETVELDLFIVKELIGRIGGKLYYNNSNSRTSYALQLKTSPHFSTHPSTVKVHPRNPALGHQSE